MSVLFSLLNFVGLATNYSGFLNRMKINFCYVKIGRWRISEVYWLLVCILVNSAFLKLNQLNSVFIEILLGSKCRLLNVNYFVICSLYSSLIRINISWLRQYIRKFQITTLLIRINGNVDFIFQWNSKINPLMETSAC